jgi:isopentenyl phosphate kinase
MFLFTQMQAFFIPDRWQRLLFSDMLPHMTFPLTILKIGGSVATRKDHENLSVRTSLMRKVARALRSSLEEQPCRLILIHGSGSAGHRLAHDFDLRRGTGDDPKKIRAALLSQRANQKLDATLADIFVDVGLPVVPIHSASVIIQNDTVLERFSTDTIAHTLTHGQIPLLYGEMVPDTRLNFSICSGDTIAAFLARKFSAEKICFASDIDGIFTEDPHRFPDASLIEHLDFDQLGARSGITGSHSVDVTGGLGGKLEKLAPLHHSSVESVEIFNGLKAEHYRNILLDIPFPHTIIRF